MLHSEGGITAQRGGMVICRTWELHNQGLSGAFGACKSFAPEGAISIGRGLRPPRPPWIRACGVCYLSDGRRSRIQDHQGIGGYITPGDERGGGVTSVCPGAGGDENRYCNYQ